MRALRGFLSRMNPTLRGFLIIAAVALVIVALEFYETLAALYILARIAFLLALAFFVYLVWRERRTEIAMWPAIARVSFYGAAVVIVLDLLAYSLISAHGLAAVGFLLVLVICGYSMFRVWRHQRTWGY